MTRPRGAAGIGVGRRAGGPHARRRRRGWPALSALGLWIVAAWPVAGRAGAPAARAPGPAPASAPATPARSAAPRHIVSVRDSPGYRPLVDPDSAAERLGRRPDARLVAMPFAGGARSIEALGRAVLGAFHAGSVDSMLALCVRPDEFRVILWPEFSQSRPATGLRWEDAWPVLLGRLNGGSTSSVQEWGGHFYTLLRIERTAGTVQYRNFKLHDGITLVARDDEGHEVRYTGIRSIAERRGRFKIYSMSD